MKKILSVAWLVLLVAVLVACKPTPDPIDPDPIDPDPVDTVAPEFSGLDTAEIWIGDEFDPLEGVSATDDVDGDVTANIVVTGAYDIERAGTYTLTYTVEDAAGNERTRTRILVVRALGGLANGDFADVNEDTGLPVGWTAWFNESQDVDVEYSVADGEFIIDILEQSIVKDNNWWDVQAQYNGLILNAFESYTLQFTVRAEAARKMVVQIHQGDLNPKGIDELFLDITTEEHTYEIDFYTLQNTENAQLQFAFGTMHKITGVPEEQHVVLGKIYLSNVRIVPGPALENQAPVVTAANILLAVGTETFITRTGVAVTDDFDNPQLSDVQFEDITEGAQFSLPAEKGIYTFRFWYTDSDGLTGEATRTITVADPFEVKGDFVNVDEETGIPEGWEIWHEETRGGLTISTSEGVVALVLTNIDSEAGNIWENQFKILNLAAFQGTYTLKFTAYALVARPVRVAMEGNGGVGLANLAWNFDLTTTAQEFEVEFEVGTNAINTNRNLQFWFGSFRNIEGYSGDDDILTTVYISNVTIIRNED